ncbi:MAG: Yip1 family protein [bacterium]
MKEKFKEIIERVKQISFKTKDTWALIKDEEATVSGIFKNHLLILAAVPALAKFLGRMIIGYQVPFSKSIRLSFGESLITALIEYGFLLLGIWVISKVFSFFAPKFNAQQDDVKSFKLAAYSYFPYLAAGILYIIPSLGVLVGLVGIYCLYILYVGIPIVLDMPKNKVIPFLIVAIVAVILVYIIIGRISGLFLKMFTPDVFIG